MHRVTKATNSLGGYVSYVYSDGNPDNNQQYKKTIKTEQIDINGNSATRTQIEYLDSFNFIYKTEVFSSDEPARIIIVESKNYYIGEKLVSEECLPYFVNSTLEDIGWDKSTFDQFHRKERIEMADGSYVRYEYRLNEVRKIATYEDETGNVTETIARTLFDKKGRLDKKYDQFDNLTDCHFNAANRVTRVDLPVDENGEIQSLVINWDSFNRKTSLEDPCLGKTYLKYDNYGNLIEQANSAGHKTTFLYDGLNRMISKTTNDGTSDNASIQYFYDTIEIGDSLTNFPKERLAKIVDNTGVHLFSYNKLGNVTVKVRDITGLGVGYTEEYEYNQFGIPLQYKFPDGSVQKISYNGMGRHANTTLDSRDNVTLANASFGDYNAAQQFMHKELGNGIKTKYEYSINGYLERLRTCGPEGSMDCTGSIVQDLTYEFFNYGIVKSISDNRSIDVVRGADANTNATQHFVYDKIGRLTKVVWGEKADPTETIEYEYNSIGNQKKRISTVFETSGSEVTLVDYVYSGQKVTEGYNSDVAPNEENQVFSADYNVYGNLTHKVVQDASGNEIAWDYKYDEENRLVLIFKTALGDLISDTPILEFTYDHNRQRVKKQYNKKVGSGTVTTWYISPNFEVREVGGVLSTSTKYLQLEGKGKISSVMSEYKPQDFALFNSVRYSQYAGLIPASSIR